MNVRPGIILQARFASARLRGKALATVAGRSILQHCLARLLATGASRIVLATTEKPEDDALVEVAARMGVLIYRGSEKDVLGRFSSAADRYDLDPVLRATGDNPAVDPGAGGRLLDALAQTGADYVNESGLPIGAGLEAMTAAALHYAASAATSAYDREHVTTFIKGHPDVFRLRTIAAPAALTEPALRLTIDTPQDLEYMRELFAHVGHATPSVVELIGAGRTLHREVA